MEKHKPVRSEVRSTVNGVIAEEAFLNEAGEIIGYWAYGYYDPGYPYQGEEENVRPALDKKEVENANKYGQDKM